MFNPAQTSIITRMGLVANLATQVGKLLDCDRSVSAFQIFQNILRARKGERTMPFPRPAGANGSPLTGVSCQVENEKARAALLSRIPFIAKSLKLPKGAPAQSASLIYLGLWHLRQSYETESQLDERAKLLAAINVYNPGPGRSVNTSYYNAWDQRHDGEVTSWPAHRPAIDAAMAAFLPDFRALKSRCLLLVDLGARTALEAKPPESEDWLVSFDFEPFL